MVARNVSDTESMLPVYFSGVEMMRFMIFDHIINDVSSDVALQFPSIQITTADRNSALAFIKRIHEI